jgi:lysyl-tRNA synthetase class 2
VQLGVERHTLEPAGAGAEAFEQLGAWVDAGDVIGAEGTIKRTNKGDLSVYVGA